MTAPTVSLVPVKFGRNHRSLDLAAIDDRGQSAGVWRVKLESGPDDTDAAIALARLGQLFGATTTDERPDLAACELTVERVAVGGRSLDLRLAQPAGRTVSWRLRVSPVGTDTGHQATVVAAIVARLTRA